MAPRVSRVKLSKSQTFWLLQRLREALSLDSDLSNSKLIDLLWQQYPGTYEFDSFNNVFKNRPAPKSVVQWLCEKAGCKGLDDLWSIDSDEQLKRLSELLTVEGQAALRPDLYFPGLARRLDADEQAIRQLMTPEIERMLNDEQRLVLAEATGVVAGLVHLLRPQAEIAPRTIVPVANAFALLQRLDRRCDPTGARIASIESRLIHNDVSRQGVVWANDYLTLEELKPAVYRLEQARHASLIAARMATDHTRALEYCNDAADNAAAIARHYAKASDFKTALTWIAQARRDRRGSETPLQRATSNLIVALAFLHKRNRNENDTHAAVNLVEEALELIAAGCGTRDHYAVHCGLLLIANLTRTRKKAEFKDALDARRQSPVLNSWIADHRIIIRQMRS